MFDCSPDNIGLHLKNIYDTGELSQETTTENFSVVQTEGERQVNRKLKFYNLDAIHEKDKAVLSLLKVDNVIERDFKTVMPEMNLKEVVDIIATSKRNLFPVVDAAGNFKGVVLLDDIRNIMFRPDLYKKMHVSRFMSPVST